MDKFMQYLFWGLINVFRLRRYYYFKDGKVYEKKKGR